ncbi:hypothetical protein [Desulfovirgula thermocuniculi]|uniref:hypothetical protein n=1 Tax=Desulfovirgula thermocuniculi TaxID=348842 RepID=UPI0004250E3E|nr:hypothetical protein [Desulfovirgula thermocuniculi]
MSRKSSHLPRTLTEEERKWLEEALVLLPTGEYMGGGRWVDVETGETIPLDPPVHPKPYLAQLNDLLVVEECGCGVPECHTVKFQHYRPGKSCALVHTTTDDGHQLVVFADEEMGLLTELEVI